MKNVITLLVLLIFSSENFAQKIGKLSLEFGYGVQQVDMSRLNQYYLDSLAKPQGLFKENIKTANQFFIGVRYQPYTLLDLGVYGNFLQKELIGNPIFYSTDDLGNATAVNGKSSLMLLSASYGLTSNIHINHILKWQEKESNFLNRSRLLVELRIGNSISNANINVQYPALPIASTYVRYQTINFESQAAVKFEYDYLKRSLINSVGLKFGYNYLNTTTLRNQFDKDWNVLNDKTINLNFSGWFASVYLVLAK